MAEVNCFGKTENYSDKITLLNTYDTNNNGRIDSMEQMQAIADWKAGKITEDEMNVIVHVWKLGEDGISKFCRRRPPCGDYGDVDGDGWVSTKDLIHTMRYTAGFSDASMTPDQKRRADVNGDGKVTQADALLIAKYIVGQYDTFAVCTKVPSTEFDCARCDFNHDGVVNNDETILLGAAYGSRPGDSNWDPKFDLNGDGVVDYKDLGILGSCMGPVGPVTPPAYLTPDEALLRIRAGERCYIKCTLPILNMLPGIPYTPGAWVPPLCAITGEP